MLTRVAALTVAALAATSSVLSFDTTSDPGFGHFDGKPPATSTATANGNQATVRIETAGSTTQGVPIGGVTYAPLPPPLCFLKRGRTGFDYYEWWKPGGEAREADTLDDFAYQGLLNPGWDDPVIAADHEGRWYEPFCSIDAPADVSDNYYRTHRGVFVPVGQPVPVDVEVDPEVLARLAAGSMVLPEATLHWNPALAGSGATLVGAETWVWAEGAPGTVSVTARIDDDTWAEVVAELDRIEVEAGGFATTDSCAGAGLSWAADAAGDPCVIRFGRSTAGLPVKAGQQLPTTTLTATATWRAWWHSSVDEATHHSLDMEPLESTAEIPVAEVQALTTQG